MSSLAGKTAIVTGASSGIGAATARMLAEEGVARRRRRAACRAARDRGRARARRHRPGELRAFVDRVVHDLGGIDILVNAAGLALGRDPFAESTEEDERAVLETNVNGLVRMTRLCLPHSRDGGPHRQHRLGRGPLARTRTAPTYVTSKFAVRGFTRALREDLLGRADPRHDVDGGLVETEFSLVRFRGDEATGEVGVRGTRPAHRPTTSPTASSSRSRGRRT